MTYDHFPSLWAALELYVLQHPEAEVLCADKAAERVIGYRTTSERPGYFKEVILWEISRQNFEMTARGTFLEYSQARLPAEARRVLLAQMVQRARNRPIPTLYDRILEDDQ